MSKVRERGKKSPSFGFMKQIQGFLSSWLSYRCMGMVISIAHKVQNIKVYCRLQPTAKLFFSINPCLQTLRNSTTVLFHILSNSKINRSWKLPLEVFPLGLQGQSLSVAQEHFTLYNSMVDFHYILDSFFSNDIPIQKPGTAF